MTKIKRRWEIVVFPIYRTRFWRFEIHKPFGKFGVFLRKTWIGPVCYKKWADPRSVSSVSRAVRIVREISPGVWG